MTSRIRYICMGVVVAIALAVSAVAASASFVARYKTPVDGGDPVVTFKLVKHDNKHYVKDFVARKLYTACSDGDALIVKIGTDKAMLVDTASSKKPFSGGDSYANWVLRIYGRLRGGGRPTGKIFFQARFNRDNTPNPNGVVKCRTVGDLYGTPWNASRY